MKSIWKRIIQSSASAGQGRRRSLMCAISIMPRPSSSWKSRSRKENELESLRELRFEPEYYHDFKKMNELDQQIDDVHVERPADAEMGRIQRTAGTERIGRRGAVCYLSIRWSILQRVICMKEAWKQLEEHCLSESFDLACRESAQLEYRFYFVDGFIKDEIVEKLMEFLLTCMRRRCRLPRCSRSCFPMSKCRWEGGRSSLPAQVLSGVMAVAEEQRICADRRAHLSEAFHE